MRSSPTRWVTSISTGSGPAEDSSNLAEESSMKSSPTDSASGVSTSSFERRAQVVDVFGGLPDNEVAERVDVPVWEQIGL